MKVLLKPFVVSLGITVGLAVAAGGLLLGLDWWSNRPKPRSANAIVASFDRALLVDADGDGKSVIRMRYILRNQTDRDISIDGSHLTGYMKREDGSLLELKKVTSAELESIEVPAGEGVLWTLKAAIPYSLRENCKHFKLLDAPDRKQVIEFLIACYNFIDGFIILTNDEERLRIDLPYVTEPKSKA